MPVLKKIRLLAVFGFTYYEEYWDKNYFCDKIQRLLAPLDLSYIKCFLLTSSGLTKEVLLFPDESETVTASKGWKLGYYL